MEALTFDVYPRDLKVEGETPANRVDENAHFVSVTTYANTFSGEDELVLCKQPVTITIHDPQPSLTTLPRVRLLTLGQPIPEPLTSVNISQVPLNPDGSLAFTPQVNGGLGPYQFSIDALDGSFSFNSTSGEITRPPQ